MTDDEIQTEASTMAFHATANLPAAVSDWTTAHRRMVHMCIVQLDKWIQASAHLGVKVDPLTAPLPKVEHMICLRNLPDGVMAAEDIYVNV